MTEIGGDIGGAFRSKGLFVWWGIPACRGRTDGLMDFVEYVLWQSLAQRCRWFFFVHFSPLI
jgi:hypothetical protein